MDEFEWNDNIKLAPVGKYVQVASFDRFGKPYVSKLGKEIKVERFRPHLLLVSVNNQVMFSYIIPKNTKGSKTYNSRWHGLGSEQTPDAWALVPEPFHSVGQQLNPPPLRGN
jgi:hypothetical protein